MLTAASSETVYFKRSNMHARKPDVVLGVFTSWNHYITIRIYLMCLTPFCSLFSPTNLSRCFISVIYHHSSFLQNFCFPFNVLPGCLCTKSSKDFHHTASVLYKKIYKRQIHSFNKIFQLFFWNVYAFYICIVIFCSLKKDPKKLNLFVMTFWKPHKSGMQCQIITMVSENN